LHSTKVKEVNGWDLLLNALISQNLLSKVFNLMKDQADSLVFNPRLLFSTVKRLVKTEQATCPKQVMAVMVQTLGLISDL